MSDTPNFQNSKLAIRFPITEFQESPNVEKKSESSQGTSQFNSDAHTVQRMSYELRSQPEDALEAEPQACFSGTKNEAVTSAKSSCDMVILSIDDIVVSQLGVNSESVDNGRSARPESVSSPTANNNCMALLPISSVTTGQLVPLALLGKPSNTIEECPGGIMQLISGKNKVAPATSLFGQETKTVGAVLMIIPKKSDSICVDMPQQDQENNCPAAVPQTEQTAMTNSTSGGAETSDAIVKPTQSYDSYEEVCRICHDNPSKLELISPCLCKGSMSKVHRTCLERWLGESAKNTCEICGYEYNTVRKPKYNGCRSVYEWIRHPLSASDTRNLFFDIACFFILTPLAAISSWLCVVGAQHYSFGDEHKRKVKIQDSLSPHGRNAIRDASNATWTSVGLLSLTGTLLAAYYIWLFVAIRYHIQVWREWQQRNFIVNIVPFEDGCMGRPPQPRVARPGIGNLNNNNNDRFGRNSHFRGQPMRRSQRFNENNNLPTIFSRSHFLENLPPEYVISDTTLMYQALYGSNSDLALNENLLSLTGDSEQWDTESSSATVVAVLSDAISQEQQTRNSVAAGVGVVSSAIEVTPNQVTAPQERSLSQNTSRSNLHSQAELARIHTSCTNCQQREDVENENIQVSEQDPNHPTNPVATTRQI